MVLVLTRKPNLAILRWGFGHHAPYLTAEQRYESLFYFFIFQCFVKNTVGITKLSFLFLYLDIFPQRKFRILCWAMVIQISLGLIALSITTILQCNPIPFSWDKSIPGGTWYVGTKTYKFEALLIRFKVLTSRRFGTASRAGIHSWTLWCW